MCANSSFAATEISPLIGFGTDTFSFKIQELSKGTSEFEYQPNTPGLTRYGLSAYGYGLAYSARNSIATVDPNNGSSQFFDFQLGYHNLIWGADLFIQNYTGFYTNSLKQTGTNIPYIFSDLNCNHYGLMARYSMDNQGFLVSALTSQSEQIKKSAGSYFLVGGYRYHSLESSSSIIPASLQGQNIEMDNLRKLKANSINLGLGVGKYWVSDSHLYIGALFDLIGTFALYNYESTTGNSNSSYLTTSTDIKIGVGYSGEHFRTGLTYAGDLTSLKGFGSALIQPTASQFLLYFRWAF